MFHSPLLLFLKGTSIFEGTIKGRNVGLGGEQTAKTIINREFKMCVGVEEGNKDSKCALLIPQGALKVAFLIIQHYRALFCSSGKH